MLEALGLPVLTAADGRDAVGLFARHADTISHVILDLSMPNMDGMAALTEIARIKPGVKVILSSGYDEQELLPRLSDRGLAAFIQKPYSLDDSAQRPGSGRERPARAGSMRSGESPSTGIRSIRTGAHR